MSDYIYRVSEKLTKVMEDIGVNERLVMKRRRTYLSMETIPNISPGIVADINMYHFGSMTEGSTTAGLESDLDALFSNKFWNVTQDMKEWEPGGMNLMMIQNENISPGYCYLRSDLSLPATVNILKYDMLLEYVTGSDGKLLWKNTLNILSIPGTQLEKHGPAYTKPEQSGIGSCDIVLACYCKSTPYQVTAWLQKQRKGKWPTEDVLNDCRSAGCFVVPVGSKVVVPVGSKVVVPVGSKVHSSDIQESELEWRISTSLQERYLMFSFNIPQLMCYILMKMILKTYINPNVQDVLSSFMCKNVLFYCLANSSHNWHTGTLLSYLHLCLFMLKECVKQRNCPHFIIPENNLLAGRMTDTQRDKLLDIIDNLLADYVQLLFKIELDHLGERLKMKLNMIPDSPDILSAAEISEGISIYLECSVAGSQSVYLHKVLNKIIHGGKEEAYQFLSETCSTLERYRNEGDLQNTASNLLMPFVHSTLGSVIACKDIDNHTSVSHQAFHYLGAGKESDALSGRLKLVSVLYCTGDMERAEHELKIIQIQYILSRVHTVCTCRNHVTGMKSGGRNNFEHDYEKAIKSNVALCTKYLQCEINCVPHELRYEILKSYIEEDRQVRKEEDSDCMGLIVVDSIPYLFFLQYKVYSQQRRTKQLQKIQRLQILHNQLAYSFAFEPNLGHKDTALNLLGQCFEQENMQTEALQCYIESLQHRPRNNAARSLLCIQLLKLWK